MRIGQGVRTGLGHGGITCVLQTQFSSFSCSGKVCLAHGLKQLTSQLKGTSEL